MRRYALFLFVMMVTLVMSAGAWGAHPSQAADQWPQNGTPESALFGYGGKIDPFAVDAHHALDMAYRLQFDWIAVDFNWDEMIPDGSTTQDLAILDVFMEKAAFYKIPVMISLRHAPGWAMTPTGPNVETTGTLVRLLAERYPALYAVELFAGANTSWGWGTYPDPAQYAVLVRRVSETMAGQPKKVYLVVGGFTPVEQIGDASSGMDESEFLQKLYDNGVGDLLEIVSIRMPVISGPIMKQPQEGHDAFRRYENIRRTMRQNGYQYDKVWITDFGFPIEMQSSSAGFAQEQSRWLHEAYSLLETQLYVGTAFFSQVNLPADSPGDIATLVRNNGSYHEALERIGALIIARSNSGQQTTISQDSDVYQQLTDIRIKGMFKHLPRILVTH